ncbi:hypothetical protein PG993_005927 [Apiospora rasikravindrae]|uniref:Uncharacterized protein n=1 Tax=Apiospora rasikravindrae TaxID=990691 RepID=A0ABR1TA68_9PEZI
MKSSVGLLLLILLVLLALAGLALALLDLAALVLQSREGSALTLLVLRLSRSLALMLVLAVVIALVIDVVAIVGRALGRSILLDDLRGSGKAPRVRVRVRQVGECKALTEGENGLSAIVNVLDVGNVATVSAASGAASGPLLRRRDRRVVLAVILAFRVIIVVIFILLVKAGDELAAAIALADDRGSDDFICGLLLELLPDALPTDPRKRKKHPVSRLNHGVVVIFIRHHSLLGCGLTEASSGCDLRPVLGVPAVVEFGEVHRHDELEVVVHGLLLLLALARLTLTRLVGLLLVVRHDD